MLPTRHIFFWLFPDLSILIFDCPSLPQAGSRGTFERVARGRLQSEGEGPQDAGGCCRRLRRLLAPSLRHQSLALLRQPRGRVPGQRRPFAVARAGESDSWSI